MKRIHARAMQLLLLMLIALCGTSYGADSPGKLRSEIARVEKDFIDLYNKVNTDPQFAIVCRMDTPTGSNRSTRVCQPRYLLQAAAKSASERIRSAVAAGDSTGSANAGGPNVGAATGGGGLDLPPDKDEAFQRNMLAALQKSPELQALGQKRDELQARLNKLR